MSAKLKEMTVWRAKRAARVSFTTCGLEVKMWTTTWTDKAVAIQFSTEGKVDSAREEETATEILLQAADLAVQFLCMFPKRRYRLRVKFRTANSIRVERL